MINSLALTEFMAMTENGVKIGPVHEIDDKLYVVIENEGKLVHWYRVIDSQCIYEEIPGWRDVYGETLFDKDFIGFVDSEGNRHVGRLFLEQDSVYIREVSDVDCSAESYRHHEYWDSEEVFPKVVRLGSFLIPYRLQDRMGSFLRGSVEKEMTPLFQI